jgi:hypothetical protein
MKRDDYISGPHHCWVHFWCGLIFGAGIGAWLSSKLFDTWPPFVALTAAIALVVALCCGRWGDAAWEWIGWFWW